MKNNDYQCEYPPSWNPINHPVSAIVCILCVTTLFLMGNDTPILRMQTAELFGVALGLIMMSAVPYTFAVLIKTRIYVRRFHKMWRSGKPVDVFISHSSLDSDIVHALAALLDAVFPYAQIRCSSMPGYGYEGGAHFTDDMRIDSVSAKVFLAILSEDSLRSSYVQFEFGARWGVGLNIYPVIIGSIKSEKIPGPLRQINAKSMSKRIDVINLIEDISEVTGLKPKPITKYEKMVNELMGISSMMREDNEPNE